MPASAPLPAELTVTVRTTLAARDAAQWTWADLIARLRRELPSEGTISRLAVDLNMPRQKLAALVRVSAAFPPDHRDVRLSFDTYARLAGLPAELRPAAVAQALAEGWGERQAHAAVLAHRQTTGAADDDDPETRMAAQIMRAWNRAPAEARGYFAALAEGAGTGIIDDEVIRV